MKQIGFDRPGEATRTIEAWASAQGIEPNAESLERFFLGNLWQLTVAATPGWPGEKGNVRVEPGIFPEVMAAIEALMTRGLVCQYGHYDGCAHYALTPYGELECQQSVDTIERFMQEVQFRREEHAAREHQSGPRSPDG